MLDTKYNNITGDDYKNDLLELINEIKVKSWLITGNNMYFTGSKYYTLGITEDNNKFLLLNFFPDNYIVINGNRLLKASYKINIIDKISEIYDKYNH